MTVPLRRGEDTEGTAMWKRRQRLVGCGQESVHTRPPRSWSRQEDLPWSLWREHSPAHTLTLDFWPSRTSRAYISVVRSHRVYDICHSSPSESRTLATYGHSAASQTSGCTVHLDLCGGRTRHQAHQLWNDISRHRRQALGKGFASPRQPCEADTSLHHTDEETEAQKGTSQKVTHPLHGGSGI